MTAKSRNCPIPQCKKTMGTNAFFCPTHYEMVPPVIGASIKQSFTEWRKLERGSPERALVAGTLKQALAFAFASICDQLDLPVPGVILERDTRNEPNRVLSHAIKKALH